MARERHDAAFIVGALLGGVVGGLYGLFTAPQAGGRTRADLTGRWDEAAERAAQKVAGLDDQVRAVLRRDEDQGIGASAAAATAAASLVGPAGPFTEADGAPVMLLPDPLEPDPVVVTEREVEVAVTGGAVGAGELLVTERDEIAAEVAAPTASSAAPPGKRDGQN